MTAHIPLSRSPLVALVDDDDAPLVLAATGTWRPSPDGRTCYAKRHIRKPDGRYSTQYLHQLITGASHIDHINGDGLDNRRCNLRPATQSQNCANRRPRVDTATGYKGVSRRDPTSDVWIARIQIDGRRKRLGAFATALEAALAYDLAAVETFGEFARLNFPKPTREDTP